MIFLACTREQLEEDAKMPTIQMSTVSPGDCAPDNTGPYCGCMVVDNFNNTWNWHDIGDMGETACLSAPMGLQGVPYYFEEDQDFRPDYCQPHNTGPFCGCWYESNHEGEPEFVPATEISEADCNEQMPIFQSVVVRLYYPGDDPTMPEVCDETEGIYCGCYIINMEGRDTFHPASEIPEDQCKPFIQGKFCTPTYRPDPNPPPVDTSGPNVDTLNTNLF
ncbi:MAG: hypothetical protein AAF570_17145 [Bacteroidota bacterium]